MNFSEITPHACKSGMVMLPEFASAVNAVLELPLTKSSPVNCNNEVSEQRMAVKLQPPELLSG